MGRSGLVGDIAGTIESNGDGCLGLLFVMAVSPGDGDTNAAPVPTVHSYGFPSTVRYSVVVKSAGRSRIRKVTAGEAI